MIAIDEVLEAGAPPAVRAVEVGRSRQGRPVLGYRLGAGRRRVSLIAGCHADEPVGPAMLDRLVAWLASLPASAPAVAEVSWHVVPHTNPDGEARNAGWTEGLFDDPRNADVDLAAYLRGAVREPPGDDVEFGFPHHSADREARPENRAVADFLRAAGGPFRLHASFHGMAFAAGPWFLIERGWIERTGEERERLRRRVRELGYRLHDVDRGGEKGFSRIDEGFTTRPDSRAMAAHFLDRGDPETAALFRPSSMEFVRSLGGDPLTLVSEMPLFLTPASFYRREELVRPPEVGELRRLAASDPEELRSRARELDVRPMPVADQMRLQLEFLSSGLAAALS